MPLVERTASPPAQPRSPAHTYALPSTSKSPGTIHPPKLKVRAEVGFVKGDLDRVFAEVTFPGEGIPLDDLNLAFLTKVRAGVTSFDPLSFTGGVSFGVGPGY